VFHLMFGIPNFTLSNHNTMRKIVLKKVVNNNCKDVLDVISTIGIPNKLEKVVRIQINTGITLSVVTHLQNPFWIGK